MKELNTYKKLPHYVISDNPSDFYIYRRSKGDNGHKYSKYSGLIKGRSDIYHRLVNIKNKGEFMKACDELIGHSICGYGALEVRTDLCNY
jgi:hypothetical protein